MTERALPAVGVGVRALPGGRRAADVAARPGVARKEAVLTTPTRAGLLVGATAAVYAVTLAGITGLQASSEASVAAARAPFLEDLATTRAANDAIEARIGKADTELHALVATYGAVGDNVTAFQARLDSLAALVADVQGSAAALPARIRLPSVSTVRISRSSGGGGHRSAPATGGKTGASGG